LNGDATADAFVASARRDQEAKPIQDSKYVEPVTRQAPMDQYRAEDGSLCRAAIERFVDSTGDSRRWDSNRRSRRLDS
jgi:hypothetical protein